MNGLDFVKCVAGIHGKIAAGIPSLSRGKVWCYECGRTQEVDGAQCLRSGWPECCGFTMSIDSPEERRALQNPNHTEPVVQDEEPKE